MVMRIRQNNPGIAAELMQKLPACAAGSSAIICHHGNGDKVTLTLADRFGRGGSFGAQSNAIRCILDITTAVDVAHLRQDGRANEVA